MLNGDRVVLLDVDDTLLDNDRAADLTARLGREALAAPDTIDTISGAG